jgi:hypothetical protein
MSVFTVSVLYMDQILVCHITTEMWYNTISENPEKTVNGLKIIIYNDKNTEK